MAGKQVRLLSPCIAAACVAIPTLVPGECPAGTGQPANPAPLGAKGYHTVFESHFNSSRAQWSVFGNDPSAPATSEEPGFEFGGGDPGGFVRAITANHDRTWYWQRDLEGADLLSSYRGFLSYSQRISSQERLYNDVDVRFVSTYGATAADPRPLTLTFRHHRFPLTADWKSFRIPLKEGAGWRTELTPESSGDDQHVATQQEMIAALANPGTLFLRGRYSREVGVQHDLDTVEIHAPDGKKAKFRSTPPAGAKMKFRAAAGGVHEKSLTLFNDGKGPLRATLRFASDSDKFLFGIQPSPDPGSGFYPGALAPGGKAHFFIRYAPTDNLTHRAELIVELGARKVPKKFTLIGRPVAAPIVITPNPLDLGDVPIGSDGIGSIEIKNVGSEQVHAFWADRGGFSVGPGSDEEILNAGQSTTRTVGIRPFEEGDFDVDFIVTDGSGTELGRSHFHARGVPRPAPRRR
jgi:hypothetical protein